MTRATGSTEADAAAGVGSTAASGSVLSKRARPAEASRQEASGSCTSSIRPGMANSRAGLALRSSGMQDPDDEGLQEVLAPAAGSVSNFGTVIVLVKSTVGGTLIVLPYGFRHAGLLPATASLAIICAMEVYGMNLLIQCVRVMGRGTFGEVAHRAMGSPLAVAVDFSMVLSQIGFVCGEMLYFAKNLAGALNKLDLPHVPSVKVFIFLQLLLVVPMSWIRRLSHFALPNFVANALVLLALAALAAVAVGGLAAGELGPEIEPVGDVNSILLFSGTSVFSFACINFVIPIYEEHEHKEQFESVLSTTLMGVCMIFIAFGTVCYCHYGVNTADVVTLNLPAASALGKVVPFAFAIASLLNVPLFMFPATTLLEARYFAPGPSRTFARKCKKNVLRTATAVLCAVLAYVGVDRVQAFVSLVGSLCCVPLAFIYPVICHLRICKPGPLGVCVDLVLGAIGVALFIVTTKQALAELTNSHHIAPGVRPKPKPRPGPFTPLGGLHELGVAV